MFEGVVTESHFANLTKLTDFYASMNYMTLKVGSNCNPPFQIWSLRLRSWDLSGLSSESLSWIQNQTDIWELDLSSTAISFYVPTYIWDIQYLNLSHNYLYGKIPFFNGANNSEIRRVYLSSNLFSGLLPRVDDTVIELDLSRNTFSGGLHHFLCDARYGNYSMRVLHLGGNNLSGELPNCWMRWASLYYLNLGNNNLFGSIPLSMGFLGNLQSLNLFNNNFSGMIPNLVNCSNLVKIDLSHNNIDGNIPMWIGTTLAKLKILILRSNKFGGEISPKICYLQSLQILDLSHNEISGIIPNCVDNFTAMATRRSVGEFDYSWNQGSVIESAPVTTKGSSLQYDTILRLMTNVDLSKNNLSGEIPRELTSLVELRSLNLSENHLVGLIPENIGDMKQLESLDLSLNTLSGKIPMSLARSSALNYLNLSCNRLMGRIPGSTQISTFSASSFEGNDLCGPPLTKMCSISEGGGEHKEEKDAEYSEMMKWIYVLLSLGYAVGFSMVCTLLVLKKAWRDAYFGWVESMWDKVYVFVCVKWRARAHEETMNE